MRLAPKVASDGSLRGKNLIDGLRASQVQGVHRMCPPQHSLQLIPLVRPSLGMRIEGRFTRVEGFDLREEPDQMRGFAKVFVILGKKDLHIEAGEERDDRGVWIR